MSQIKQVRILIALITRISDTTNAWPWIIVIVR